ncbi:MAG: DUF4258 domain-containing protein [Sphingobacteriia bacterium]|nr:DUF4258 domain-containing protein [Sphingobacteriia bacterium]
MQTTTAYGKEMDSGYAVTRHGRERMSQRGISEDKVLTALDCGREVHVRGAVIYAVGRREIERYRALGLDLSRCQGVQVVCTKTGEVITTYRNQDFRRLRPRRRLGRTLGRTH